MDVTDLELSREELAILRVLQDDPNRPRKDIARECGISQSSLSKLVRRVQEGGGIRRMNAMILDPRKLGIGALAFFRVECEYEAVEEVIITVALMQEVQEVHLLFGTMNSLLLKVRGKTTTEIFETQGKIRGIKGVRDARGDIVISKKEETDLPI